jgi:anti-sigma regulatory factor (Ser/Thr protein kinase)
MTTNQFIMEPNVAEIPRLNEWVEEVLAAGGVGPTPMFNTTLVIEEAVMNVIDHAFEGLAPPHKIELSVTVGPDLLRVELCDNGHAFDPLTAPVPDITLSLDERKPGGLGVHFMRTMMDRVEYRREAGENRLVLEKSLP